ncbi:PAS domain-containing protein [Roseateles aquatilis]|nr:PAS domain-containing protein [Roseateles aquatilis]
MGIRHHEVRNWRSAVESGAFGVWDLSPQLEVVHYSPRWKEHLGFPHPDQPDSTAFWRCRVHPEDLEPMMLSLRAHFDGFTDGYEQRFRLRSNGSGYRTVLSRGRVVQRDHRGDVLRMLGTMVDLTARPVTPFDDRFMGDVAPLGSGGRTPFHTLLSLTGALVPAQDLIPDDDTAELLDQVAEIMARSLEQVMSTA